MPSFDRNISRLLTLLLILLLGYLGAHTVNGSANLGNITEYSKNISGGVSLERLYYLNSRCSDKNVQMRLLGKPKKALNARGRRHGEDAILVFESHGQGQIRIRGNHAQKYLCFSRKGRLIVRAHDRKGMCLFEEILEDNYTMIRSAVNPRWHVGFNRRGKKMKAWHYNRKNPRKSKCYQFRKVEYRNDKRHWRHRTNHRHGPMANVNLSKMPPIFNNR